MVRFSRNGVWKIAVLAAVFFLIGSCGGGNGGGGGGPITVNGIVVDSSSAPISGANVILNHDAASLVTTGADGTFSFTSVTPPYTLTMKLGIAILEYRNLSRADPQISTGITGTTFNTILAGDVTGPTYPLPGGQGILVGATNNVLTSAVADASGHYAEHFIWSGGPTKTTDLAALRFSYSGSIITGYSQYGVRTGVILNDGVAQSGLDIALTSPVTTANTILNYNAGAYTVATAGRYLLLRVNDAHFFVSTVAIIPGGTPLVLPSDGATFSVTGQDTGGNQAIRIAPAVLGGTTTIDLPATTVLKNSLPSNGAASVSTTPTLSWTPVNGADVYVVSLAGPGVGYFFYLPGSSSSLTIPDYTALGLPLASGTNYGWFVLAYKSGSMTMDAVTDPASSGLSTLNWYQALNLDVYTSAATNFTTAP